MTALIVVVAALVLIAIVAVVVYTQRARRRRAELQAGFGGEYDRALASSENRREAERELVARQKEHEQLDLRPLSDAARARYQEQWGVIQANFVDRPVLALSEADNLVTRLLADRGYRTDGFEDQARMLSVEHAHVIDDYRRAHAVELESRAGTADTEQVRTAMLDFRRVFEDVMGDTVSLSSTDAAPAETTAR